MSAAPMIVVPRAAKLYWGKPRIMPQDMQPICDTEIEVVTLLRNRLIDQKKTITIHANAPSTITLPSLSEEIKNINIYNHSGVVLVQPDWDTDVIQDYKKHNGFVMANNFISLTFNGKKWVNLYG